jgi:hypothetical protein
MHDGCRRSLIDHLTRPEIFSQIFSSLIDTPPMDAISRTKAGLLNALVSTTKAVSEAEVSSISFERPMDFDFDFDFDSSLTTVNDRLLNLWVC